MKVHLVGSMFPDGLPVCGARWATRKTSFLIYVTCPRCLRRLP